MRYRTTKCVDCGHALEDRVPYAKEWLGPPRARCPRCGNTFSTGMNYWTDMTT